MLQKNKTINNYAKYSSIAFQMGFTVFLGAFGGVKLDDYLKWGFPVFTVSLSILAVIIAMYNSIKDFIKVGDKDNNRTKKKK